MHNNKKLNPLALMYAAALLLIATPASTAAASDTAGAPEWYGTLRMGHRLILVGYGQGPNLKEAKANALNDIAQQIETRIQSETDIRTASGATGASTEATQSVRTYTSQRLEAAKRIRNEQTSDGQFFVAYSVDLRPKVEVIAAVLRQQWGGDKLPSKIDWRGHQVIVSSDMISDLNRRLTQRDFPAPVRRIDASLRRSQGQWLLVLNDHIERIGLSDLASLLNWSERGDGLSLGMKPLGKSRGRNRLQAGDLFIFNIEAKKPGGYVTIFNLYPDGRVAVIEDSRQLTTALEVPSRKQQQEGQALEAYTAEPGRVAQDIYLAIHSPRALDTTRFQAIVGDNAEPVKGEGAYQLDRFLRWLDRQEVLAMSVLRVEVRP